MFWEPDKECIQADELKNKHPARTDSNQRCTEWAPMFPSTGKNLQS